MTQANLSNFANSCGRCKSRLAESHCGQGVTFPDAWFPHGDHIDGCLQKGSALEPFQLEFQGWAKMPRLKGQKGLSCRQARLAQQPCGPSCYALRSLDSSDYAWTLREGRN